VLADAVRDASPHAEPRVHRSHVDDDAFAFGEHDASGGLRAQKRRGEVELEHGAPVLEAQILGGSDAGHPGIVDEDVDGTVRGESANPIPSDEPVTIATEFVSSRTRVSPRLAPAFLARRDRWRAACF